MIPVRDVIPTRTTPYVTLTLIALNAAAFAYQLSIGERVDALVAERGLVPAAFSWMSLLTSMFLHGSVLHAGVNLLYLWIFGDNVEDRMGHGRFLAFYVLCGTAAALVHTVVSPDPRAPAIGASGAIAGVMGAYFLMYPHSRIVTIVPIVVFLQMMEVPAIFFLGLWVLLQALSGAGSIAAAAGGAPAGGLALWAHLAGFAAGVSGVMLFRRPERQRVEWWDQAHR